MSKALDEILALEAERDALGAGLKFTPESNRPDCAMIANKPGAVISQIAKMNGRIAGMRCGLSPADSRAYDVAHGYAAAFGWAS